MSLIIQYAGEILFICFIVVVFSYLGYRIFKHRNPDKETFLRILLWAYLGAIFCVNVLPNMDFGIYTQTGKPYFHIPARASEMSRLNLIPFRTISEEISGIPGLAVEDKCIIATLNILGNLLLYIPVGFLLSMNKRLRISRALLLGVLLSCLFEILQYFSGRSADIDDLLLQLLGFAAGYGFCKLWNKRMRS